MPNVTGDCPARKDQIKSDIQCICTVYVHTSERKARREGMHVRVLMAMVCLRTSGDCSFIWFLLSAVSTFSTTH